MGLVAPRLVGFKPTDITGLRFWHAADFPENLLAAPELPGSKITRFFDHGSLAGHCDQGTDADRLVYDIRRGRPAATCPNVATAGAASILGTASYTFLSNGSGCTVYAVARRSVNTAVGHVLYDTGDVASAARVGFKIDVVSTNDRLRMVVGNGSGTFVVNFITANNTWPENDNANVVVTQFSTANGFSIRINGVDRGSGGLIGAASAAAPNFTLGLANDSTAGGGNQLFGDWLEGGAYDTEISMPDILRLESYLNRWRG